MWKLKEFSAIQILRRNNLKESISPKTAFLAIIGALNFVTCVKFQPFKKCKNESKSKFQSPKICLLADFALLESPKLISRKI